MFLVFILCLLTMANVILSQDMAVKLDKRMVVANSLVCVGLDPDITKMPTAITNAKQKDYKKVYSFLQEIIDITAPHACCFKIQKAFYDQLDKGHKVLEKTIHYIHMFYPDIPVILDCKIGDIDNTMQAYMRLVFDDLKTDAVVINPYMGDDVVEPFIQDKCKCAVVLIQTSNPSAKVVQELTLLNGKKLWQEILGLVLNRWNKNNNLIPVLSSNIDDGNYALIRKQIPQDTPILLAGIGIQGGNPNVLRQLLNDEKRGVFVNSSRGILYPYASTSEHWKTAVLNAVLELKNMLNNIRFM